MVADPLGSKGFRPLAPPRQSALCTALFPRYREVAAETAPGIDRDLGPELDDVPLAHLLDAAALH